MKRKIPISLLRPIAKFRKSCHKAAHEIITPFDRVSEIMYGVIMTLTFTSTLAAINSGTMSAGLQAKAALGCNLAWGIVDGVMFVLSARVKLARDRFVINKLRNTTNEHSFLYGLRELLPKSMVTSLTETDIKRFRLSLQNPELTRTKSLPLSVYISALLIAALVFGSTFPLILPLLLISNPTIALYLSQTTALLMLLGLGRILAHWTGGNAWRDALFFVILGALLTLLCNMLGG